MLTMITLTTLLTLTHWGRVTLVCVGKLTIISSDNGLSPGRRQAIISTNAGILLIGSLGTNFNEIVIGIQTFSVKKMHLKMSSGKWPPLCFGLNVLIVKVKGMVAAQWRAGFLSLLHVSRFSAVKAWTFKSTPGTIELFFNSCPSH